MTPTPPLDTQFVSMLQSIDTNELFSMLYDRTQIDADLVAKLTGDERNLHLVNRLLNSMDLSFANKDHIRDPNTVWPGTSRIPAALKILAMALAHQASLNPEFVKFSTVEAVTAQFNLMEQFLSDQGLALYDLRVGLVYN